MESCANRTQVCPDCGWPESEIYQVVSRHLTSTGMVLYTRCACGRLQVRALNVPGGT
ncbi:hypothetical protein [Streptomonospora alba]|uniref:hypothetical protein n=1 Tax=Streptomonospora alba TaxID=183763 RepID=UPI0012ED23E4|nr:hypothetical protein [Streptomonospora alba]